MNDYLSPERKNGRKVSDRWSKIIDSYSNIKRAFILVIDAHKPSSAAMALSTVVGALIPPAQAWLGKLIVDGVVNAINTGIGAEAGLRSVLPYLAAELALFLLQAGNMQLRTLAEHILHSRINLAINSRIIKKAIDLDLVYFENPEFYDKLQNARREADFRSLRIVNNGFMLIQNTITLASFAVLLVSFSPWLAALLFLATLPAFIAQNKFAELSFRVLSWRAPESRKLNYLEHLLTDYESVKEVKLFGLGEPLLGRYASLFWKFLQEDQSIATRRSIYSLGWGLLATLSYYVAYAWIVWQAVGGAITLGDMTLYLSIARSSQGRFESLLNNLTSLYENGLFMSNLFAFLALEPKMQKKLDPVPISGPIGKGIEFHNVSFQYEGSEEWALRNVNLTIRPGEKVALVGLNGAGKTTLIKLLTRLYDPTEGQILLDGIDLRDIDVRDLHKKIGVIFQDFVRYHLSASENVGFGQIDALADQPRIEKSAKKSGAHEIIQTMPEGYETVLGRWFNNGRDLSGGEWQKIALARAFMRDCEVLVLDEPTAALDAENELRVFQQFRELAEDKMAVLISHRFSTVRMADRIFVIDKGHIVEEGSHEDLLLLGGRYARLFTLQAESYR
ncbi:MAG: ABC transporter ATP-binding protein [Chloroflexi bacterium]|nr:MAG: ABC transporter ATP-binding protein [Chloroflexota bacterium]